MKKQEGKQYRNHFIKSVRVRSWTYVWKIYTLTQFILKFAGLYSSTLFMNLKHTITNNIIAQGFDYARNSWFKVSLV